MKPIMILLAALCLSVSLQAQQLEISQPRKAVRTSVMWVPYCFP